MLTQILLSYIPNRACRRVHWFIEAKLKSQRELSPLRNKIRFSGPFQILLSRYYSLHYANFTIITFYLYYIYILFWVAGWEFLEFIFLKGRALAGAFSKEQRRPYRTFFEEIYHKKKICKKLSPSDAWKRSARIGGISGTKGTVVYVFMALFR